MKSTTIWVLAILNALLLAGLIGRVSTPNAAWAQNRPARPGDYLMIPGEVSGGSTSVVYVLDTTNGMLGALAYDDAQKRFDTMPGRIDIAQVFSQAQNMPRPPDDKKPKRGY